MYPDGNQTENGREMAAFCVWLVFPTPFFMPIFVPPSVERRSVSKLKVPTNFIPINFVKTQIENGLFYPNIRKIYTQLTYPLYLIYTCTNKCFGSRLECMIRSKSSIHQLQTPHRKQMGPMSINSHRLLSRRGVC